MAKDVTVVVTSDRYGGGSADFVIERAVLPEYPELNVTLVGAEPSTPAEMIRLAATADAMLLSTREDFTQEIASQIPRVKVIGRYGVGLDNVDLDAATDYGIVVTHFPQYCTDEVADHALSFILAANRRIIELDQDIRTGAWTQHGADTVSTLRGRLPAFRELTIGIVAFGAIGRAVATRLQGFRPTLIAHDPYVDPAVGEPWGVTFTSLEELLQRADIVTLHTPLNAGTRGLIGARELELMKADAVLVNTSRGPIVQQDALIAHLRTHPRFRAYLDVVEHEPVPEDSPLLTLSNVVLTPHAAYYSERSNEVVQRETLIGALDVLSGRRPVTVGNPQVLGKVQLLPNPRLK